MNIVYIWLAAFIIGMLYSFISKIPVQRSERPSGKLSGNDFTENPGSGEQLEFYNQQLRDYKLLYDLAMLELSDAQTIQKKRTCQQRLISLDNKIFSIQQKIYKLRE